MKTLSKICCLFQKQRPKNVCGLNLLLLFKNVIKITQFSIAVGHMIMELVSLLEGTEVDINN